TCFQRCVGLDGINAIWSTTYDLDQAKGTDYHQRFRKFLGEVQRQDLMCAGAMTDVKGDRSLAPWKQADNPNEICW
ncbi:MAG TPA: 4-hydroxyphenylacetate 3-hydroxylase N-terminal domain-containing protein, partial [Verrucomicrobiae bacterium]